MNNTRMKLPTDEKTKLQWLNYMGRTVEESQKWWTLCSKYFSKSDIYFCDQLLHLRKGSVPIVYNSIKENEEVENLNKRRRTSECEVPQQTESSIRSPLTDKSKNISIIQGKDIEFQNISGDRVTKELAKELIIPARTPQEILANDHGYTKSVDGLERQLDAALKKIEELTKDRRNLQRKEQRVKTRVHSMKEIVNDIQRQYKLLEDGAYRLENFTDIPSKTHVYV